jgi:hypothetical protein
MMRFLKLFWKDFLFMLKILLGCAIAVFVVVIIPTSLYANGYPIISTIWVVITVLSVLAIVKTLTENY